MTPVTRPRLLLIADVYNWAIHTILRAISPRLSSEFEVKIHSAADVQEEEAQMADVIYYSFWYMHKWFPRALDVVMPHADRAVVGVHSHFWFESGIPTTPEEDIVPRQEHIRLLREFPLVLAISPRLGHLMGRVHPRVMVARNGVDIDLFRPKTLPSSKAGPLVVGWAGNLHNHPGKRGVDLMREAIERCGGSVVFHPAVSNYEKADHDSMPAYYNSIDVYLCASRCEGASTPIREAMACGRPVVSTRVGDSPELIGDGVSGWLVDRSVEAIALRLEALAKTPQQVRQAGAAARRVVADRWSWDAVASEWAAAFREVL